MKFKVVKSSERRDPSDPNYVSINIENLEDFITWVSKQDNSVIVSVRSYKEAPDYEIPELEIYDDYRE